MVAFLNTLRQRLPAPRQYQEVRRSRKDGNFVESGQAMYEYEGVGKLAHEAPSWYRCPARRHLYLLLFPAAVCSYATSGYDGSLLNAFQTVSHFDEYFDSPRGSKLGLMSAIMSLGSICSTPLAPLVADRYGRRWGITSGSVIMIIGSVIQALSINLTMFIISRFLLGFGLSFATTAAPSLVTELFHPKDRVTITAICNTCWSVGSIIAAWITFGTQNIDSNWSWRLPSFFQMAPSVLQLAAIWFVPESPRWLVSKDRDSEALDALKRFHGNGEEKELVKLEYQEIRAAIDLERYLARIMDSVGITNKDTQALVNGILNVYNFALALTTAFFVERLGRRILFRISTVGMLTVFIAWTIASARFHDTGASAAGIAVMVLIFLYGAFYNIGLSPLAVAYSVEVLPFSIRAKGMAAYVFLTKAAVFVNQYVNPVGLDSIGWKYYLVYVAILAVEGFIAYGWFVETKGKALEEIAILFDKDEADGIQTSKDGEIPIAETQEYEEAGKGAKNAFTYPLSFVYGMQDLRMLATQYTGTYCSAHLRHCRFRVDTIHENNEIQHKQPCMHETQPIDWCIQS
ncbi:Sugar/inositol transporter [Fusarium oxysporum f. sp. vasinfectum]|nr:Sugar/inositol transporter [Fusarium oxysporum f. sp. vasinfectum]